MVIIYIPKGTALTHRSFGRVVSLVGIVFLIISFLYEFFNRNIASSAPSACSLFLLMIQRQHFDSFRSKAI